MRRGVYFPYREDPAHFVEHRGVRGRYTHALHRLTDPNRGGRVQTSSRPIGVARNMPSPQRFDGPINLNAPHAVQTLRSAGPNSKWAQGARFYDLG